MDEKLIEKFIEAEKNFPERVRQVMLVNHVILETHLCKKCIIKIYLVYNYFAEKHNLLKLTKDFLK